MNLIWFNQKAESSLALTYTPSIPCTEVFLSLSNSQHFGERPTKHIRRCIWSINRKITMSLNPFTNSFQHGCKTLLTSKWYAGKAERKLLVVETACEIDLFIRSLVVNHLDKSVMESSILFILKSVRILFFWLAVLSVCVCACLMHKRLQFVWQQICK